MRQTLDFPERWSSRPLHRPRSGLPPILTLHLIELQSTGYLGQWTDHSPLSLGWGCPDPQQRLSYRNRILFIPSRPGTTSLVSLSGVGTGGSVHWVSPVGLLHLNYVSAWTDASQDFVQGHRQESSCPYGPKSVQCLPTVLLCILAVQHPRGAFVSGGSSRHSASLPNWCPKRRTGLPHDRPTKRPRPRPTVGSTPGLFLLDRSEARGSLPSRRAVPERGFGRGIQSVEQGQLKVPLWLHRHLPANWPRSARALSSRDNPSIPLWCGPCR